MARPSSHSDFPSGPSSRAVFANNNDAAGARSSPVWFNDRSTPPGPVPSNPVRPGSGIAATRPAHAPTINLPPQTIGLAHSRFSQRTQVTSASSRVSPVPDAFELESVGGPLPGKQQRLHVMSRSYVADSLDAESEIAGLADLADEDVEHPSGYLPHENADDDEPSSYDLGAPPPAKQLHNFEFLAERLFSVDHLNSILRDQNSLSRFRYFLGKYRPGSADTLRRYLELQKALSAVEYANAIADNLAPGCAAAMLEEGFEAISRNAINDLVNDALPGYITHRFTQLATDVLVKEITGQSTPIFRELVAGLAEVYCLTDPSLPDNPIVYASDEFFRCTQYGRDYVIGRNCRFLQGPKSSGSSVQRLAEALEEGVEICETLLNYRRDGSPFLNLLLIAPLYDNKGAVRYFIGAQIDINGLIEGGRGLDSFERLLRNDRRHVRCGHEHFQKDPQAALDDFSLTLGEKDMEALKRSGHQRNAESSRASSADRSDNKRRYVGMDEADDGNLWPSAHLGSSGRLPGVFQNYLLVRPYPSLRITFTSPALRIPGLLQSKFLDRIGGPPHIYDGILSAFQAGVGVTAKITWLPTTTPGEAQSSGAFGGSNPHADFTVGRQRWIHCTPLLGSDDKVGVWMVVMVESETITGAINVAERQAAQQRLPDRSRGQYNQADGGRQASSPVLSPHFSGGKLYREYMRREGRGNPDQTAPPVGYDGTTELNSGGRATSSVAPGSTPQRSALSTTRSTSAMQGSLAGATTNGTSTKSVKGGTTAGSGLASGMGEGL